MPPIDPRLTRGLQLGIQGTAQAEQVAKPGSIVGGQTQVGKTYREQVGKSNEEMLFENLGNIVKGAEAGVDAMAKIRTNIEEKELGEFEINATKILEDEQMSPTDKQDRLDTFVKENAPKTWILTGKRDRLIAGIISSGKKQFNYDEKKFLDRRIQEYSDEFLKLNEGASTIPPEYLLGKLQSDAGFNALLSSGSTEARIVMNNFVLARNTQTKLQVQTEMDRKIEMVSIPDQITNPQDLQIWILGTGRAWKDNTEVQRKLLQSLTNLIDSDDQASRNMYIDAMSEVIGLDAFVKTLSGKTLVETMADTEGVTNKEDLGFIARIHKKLSDDFDRIRGLTLAQNASLNEVQMNVNAFQQMGNLNATSNGLKGAVDVLKLRSNGNLDRYVSSLKDGLALRIARYSESGLSRRESYRKALTDFSFLGEGEKSILENEFKNAYKSEARQTINQIASRNVDPTNSDIEKSFKEGIELAANFTATDEEVKAAVEVLSNYYLRKEGTEDDIRKLEAKLGIDAADITPLLNKYNSVVDKRIKEGVQTDLERLAIKQEDLTIDTDLNELFDSFLVDEYPNLNEEDRKLIIKYLDRKEIDVKELERFGIDNKVYRAFQNIRNAQEVLRKTFEEKRSKTIQDTFDDALKGLEGVNPDVTEGSNGEKPLIQSLTDGSIDPKSRDLLISISGALEVLKSRDLINRDGDYDIDTIMDEGDDVKYSYEYLKFIEDTIGTDIFKYVAEYDRSVSKMISVASSTLYDVLRANSQEVDTDVLQKAVDSGIGYVLGGSSSKVDFGTDVPVFNADGTWTPEALQKIVVATLTANRLDQDTTAAKTVGKIMDVVGSRLAQVKDPSEYSDPNRILDIAVLHVIGKELKFKRLAGNNLASVSPAQFPVVSAVISSNISENLSLTDIITNARKGEFTPDLLAFRLLTATEVPSGAQPGVNVDQNGKPLFNLYANSLVAWSGFMSQELVQTISSDDRREYNILTSGAGIKPSTDAWNADTFILQLQRSISTDTSVRTALSVYPDFKAEFVQAIKPLVDTFVKGTGSLSDDEAIKAFALLVEEANREAPMLLPTVLRAFFAPQGVHDLKKIKGQSDSLRFVKALQIGLDISIGQQLAPGYSKQAPLNGMTIGPNQNTVFVLYPTQTGLPERPENSSPKMRESRQGFTRPDLYRSNEVGRRLNVSTVDVIFDDENPDFAFSRLPEPQENQSAFLEFMLGKRLAGLSDDSESIQTQDFVEGKIVTRTILPPPKGITRFDTPGNYVNPNANNGTLALTGSIVFSPRISGNDIKASPDEIRNAYLSTLDAYMGTNNQRNALYEAADKVLKNGPVSYRVFLERVDLILKEDYNLPSLFTDDFKGFSYTVDSWRLSQQKPFILPSPRFSGRNTEGRPFIQINDQLLKLLEPTVEKLRKKHQKILEANAELGNKDDDISRETLRRRIRFIEEDYQP